MASNLTSEQDLLKADSLRKLQAYVQKTGVERGFADETAQDSFMLLIEELGEVAKAMRPLHGVKVANDSIVTDLSLEIADVQLLLMSLCNKLGIDVWDAIVTKERRNRTRTWK